MCILYNGTTFTFSESGVQTSFIGFVKLDEVGKTRMVDILFYLGGVRA